MAEDQLLTIPQVAERLRIGTTRAWAMAQRNEIPVIRLGRSVRVDPHALRRWLEEQTKSAV